MRFIKKHNFSQTGRTWLPVLIAGILAIACESQTQYVEISSVSISQPSAEMVIGETLQLRATISPSNASDKNVTWSSSKQSVATVDENGLVTAIAEGDAIIYASAGGKRDQCEIIVNKKFPSGSEDSSSDPVESITSITLDRTDVSLSPNETIQLKATIKPDELARTSITWTSSKTEVATVADGLVKAVSAGETTITAVAGGKSATCTVKVIETVIEVESMEMSIAKIDLYVGGTYKLVAVLFPDYASDKSVEWSSSNENIATVSQNGEVVAKKEGEAIITATHKKLSATCKVNVITEKIPVTMVMLDKTSITLAVGVSERLTATIVPENATDKNVQWSSSNSNVASVVAGLVTGIAEGEATIVAYADGKTATCSVTVIEVPVAAIRLDADNLKLFVGEKHLFTASVFPDNATHKNVLWYSSNTNIVSIDNAGLAQAISPGDAKVTASSGDYSASCWISVRTTGSNEGTEIEIWN